MLFILHTVPVALSADSKLVRNTVLLKLYKCMKEEIKFIVVLSQKSRHLVEICGMKQRRIRLVTMGFDLQPDGLTAGLAGHC